MRLLSRGVSFVVSIGLASACTEPAEPDFSGLDVEPLNQECQYTEESACGTGGGGGGGGSGGGPSTSDPAPLAPGYWLASVHPSQCFSQPVVNDADADGMNDLCERALAEAFRPEMMYSPYDCNTGGEPYWAVRYFPAEGVVRVIYMFAYYVDCGNYITALGYWVDGHYGDSEFITVDIKFNASAEHWYVWAAFFGAHHNASGDSSIWVPGCYSSPYNSWEYTNICQLFTTLEWVQKEGGYFRVWVALGKHGSYVYRWLCNKGGIGAPLGEGDNCDSNLSEGRLYYSSTRNIGSSHTNLVMGVESLHSCVPSVNQPLYFGTECFWLAGDTFAGWSDINVSTSPYREILDQRFETTNNSPI